MGGSQQKGRGPGFYIYLVILLVALSVVGYYVNFWQEARSETDTVAETLLKSLTGGGYETAYAMVGEEYKKTNSYDEFVYSGQTIRSIMGAYKNSELENFALSGSPYGTVANSSVEAKFEHGSATVTFTFEKKDGKWLVEQLMYEGPLVKKRLKCPSCQALNERFLPTCTHCNAKMGI